MAGAVPNLGPLPATVPLLGLLSIPHAAAGSLLSGPALFREPGSIALNNRPVKQQVGRQAIKPAGWVH